MINIVIPMAGLGSRFSKIGIDTPKPLIEVVGKKLIEHSVTSLGISGRYIFITRKYDNPEYNKQLSEATCDCLLEGEYQGRDVPLGKPMAGDVKKFKVYVKNPSGKVVKVNFGHGGTSAAAKGEKTMRIRKSNPKARKSFRARHNCDTPGPRTKARYWSCRKW